MNNVTTTAELHDILKRITFGPSGVMLHTMDLRWDVKEVRDREAPIAGWLIRFNFLRPDTTTGVVGRGTGRWELIEYGASVTSAVKTCWLLLELLVRHELMESFLYDGVRIFDPHADVSTLYFANRKPSDADLG